MAVLVTCDADRTYETVAELHTRTWSLKNDLASVRHAPPASQRWQSKQEPFVAFSAISRQRYDSGQDTVPLMKIRLEGLGASSPWPGLGGVSSLIRPLHLSLLACGPIARHPHVRVRWPRIAISHAEVLKIRASSKGGAASSTSTSLTVRVLLSPYLLVDAGFEHRPRSLLLPAAGLSTRIWLGDVRNKSYVVAVKCDFSCACVRQSKFGSSIIGWSWLKVRYFLLKRCILGRVSNL